MKEKKSKKKDIKNKVLMDVSTDKSFSGAWARSAAAAIDFYDHHIFRSFLIIFLRTAVLYYVTLTVFKNINRSNIFFAIFVPVFLFFVSSVFKYCYVPNTDSPYILNMAFFYSGLTIILFNVFAHNAAIGMLSTPDMPGAIIVIVPCIIVFVLIYLFAMKLDVLIMSWLRKKCYGLFHKSERESGKEEKVNEKKLKKEAKEQEKLDKKEAKAKKKAEKKNRKAK